ncbi:hypothetical protein DXG01_011799 [Tephrocybe rancida]|nr:hypothetical protein DXG01_011799 [Tephrocybe rancida]
MPKPSILIIGASGTVGSAVVKRFDKEGRTGDILLTYFSRPLPQPYHSIKFDWSDPTTFDPAFDDKYAITTLFILFPMSIFDTLGKSKKFLDEAKARGVKRFVVLSGTLLDKGTKPIGDVHEYIVDTLKVDYSILRMCGDFALFSGAPFQANIRDFNFLASGMKDGRIPLVHVDDVADVAYRALTDAQSPNKEQVILGPELFNLDEVAALLSRSDILNRKITHIRLTKQQSLNMLKKAYKGNPEQAELAAYWSAADERDAEGVEEAFFYREGSIIGTHRLEPFVMEQAKAGVWTPPQ